MNKMKPLILPLLMYKESGSIRKGTKKKSFVIPSWNHLYTIVNNRPILDKWALLHKRKIINIAKEWKEETGWKKTIDQKVIIKTKVFWPTARKSDPHNIDKLILDALEEAELYDNDCNVLLQYQDFDLDLEYPRIELILIPGPPFDRKKRKRELQKKNKKNT